MLSGLTLIRPFLPIVPLQLQVQFCGCRTKCSETLRCCWLCWHVLVPARDLCIRGRQPSKPRHRLPLGADAKG
jgi:hypothetical protein